MNATIERVFEQPRAWNSDKFPDACSVQGLFTDGSRFELATKTNKAPEHVAALQALVGKEAEFDCEEKPEYQGQRQWKMKSYPGKPEKSFGGGKSYTPAWGHTEEGERYTQERMDRRTALMQAVAVQVATTHVPQEMMHYPDTLQQADAFYRWLRDTDAKPVVAGRVFKGPPITYDNGEAPNPAPREAGGPRARDWNGPGQCPECHAPAGKPHGKVCIQKMADQGNYEAQRDQLGD